MEFRTVRKGDVLKNIESRAHLALLENPDSSSIVYVTSGGQAFERFTVGHQKNLTPAVALNLMENPDIRVEKS